MPTISCAATWFTCPPGSGACGTCDTNLEGAAWPWVTGHPPNFASDCGSSGVLERACGFILSVSNLCPPNSCVFPPIVDHGPGTSVICKVNYPPCDRNHGRRRLIDLTEYTFIELGGDPSDGIIPVTVTF